jgi:peptidoglycan/LPS O-acetylase OafA/YrhL
MPLHRTAAAPTRGVRRGRGNAPRRDLQGLRALAVLAVVVAHVGGAPRGGFVGVDVFFVIGGFLVTGRLLRDHEQDGRISVVDFFARRARRIVPAAAVVLVVTVAASALVLDADRATDVRVDGIWAALSLANWHFLQTGVDCLATAGAVSPLQHFSPLAIGGQLTVVWPLLIVVALRPRRGEVSGTVTARLVRLCGVVVLGSLCWAAWSTHTSPSTACLSTWSRAWAPALGALAAVLSRPCLRLPRWARETMAWAGIAGLICAVAVAGRTNGSPFPWALLPALATTLVVASGVGSEARSVVVLRNPLTDYLGRISYSLYLWHLPVLVLAAPVLRSLLGGSSPLALVVVLVLATGLAVATLHLVEEPVRRSRWLADRSRRRQRVPLDIAVAVIASAAALIASGLALTTDGRTARTPTSEFSGSGTADPDRTSPRAAAERQEAIVGERGPRR